MNFRTIVSFGLVMAMGALSACGFLSGDDNRRFQTEQQRARAEANLPPELTEERETIWDLFRNRDDPNQTVAVNRYLWNASLDVLDFLPIEAADPFTGVIVTGYGRPPGGGRAYRATIRISDPALDARSLRVSLQTSGGRAVDADTLRAVEDAILTRARQLRIQDAGL